MTYIVPRAALARFVRDIEAATARPVPPNNEPLRLLKQYARLLQLSPPTTPELQHLTMTHIHDLIVLTLGATRDGAAAAEGGLRAARLRTMKAIILGNLANPDLSVKSVAQRSGITSRYVHMLFEAEGTTFSAFVLAQRLSLASRMLRDPRFENATISTVAFESGFGDLSYFYRVFRRRFGMKPSEARH